jgi:hypothetical protein
MNIYQCHAHLNAAAKLSRAPAAVGPRRRADLGYSRDDDRIARERAVIDPSSRARLKPASARHFEGDTLFAKIARVVCEADCLPRKELFESWEVARRARRRMRGGRVVDLACGHGLVAHVLMILDDTSPAALCVDTRVPPSAAPLSGALTRAWPRLAGRVAYREGALEDVPLTADDLVVSCHACGALTDDVLSRAVDARARVAVLPCCHDVETCDSGQLSGWMDAPLAIDATRARRLADAGYDVHTQEIPASITPKNRLLMGAPHAPA